MLMAPADYIIRNTDRGADNYVCHDDAPYQGVQLTVIRR
jgi:hypothetical protein